jgi:dethiobiotin synthetase
MRQVIFVTSSRRRIGKTLVASALLRRFRALKHRSVGVKPVETECGVAEDHDLYSADGLLLAAESEPQVPLPVIAPYLFPQRGTGKEVMDAVGLDVQIADLREAVLSAYAYGDLLVVEGAVAATAPIAADGLEIDLARALSAKVIVVEKTSEEAAHAIATIEAHGGVVEAVVTRDDDLQGDLRVRLPWFEGGHGERVAEATRVIELAGLAEQLAMGLVSRA